MARSKDRIVEEYLVASARLGDRAAASKLVALRGPRLLAHATRLIGNREDARDIVQDAWIEILRGLGQLQDDRAFPAWSTRIVTRRVARVIADKVKHRDLAATEGAGATWTDSDGPTAVDARAVRKAIAALPRDQAATIALFYLEDMSVAEVAHALDVPAGTIKTRLMHARTKLSQALKGGTDDETG
ncbi:MAG: sigma-70 family RNA polymerase sigma factor [Pseudomonadota bacterium]